LKLLKNSGLTRVFLFVQAVICVKQTSGGTSTMMGQQTRSESLFYYFRLEDQIPEDHLLRLIDQHVELSFVRERVKGLYSSTGRPSIDPEVLLRLLLVGYLYGITSERRLLEEVKMQVAYRWFTRLDFGQEIPDHSTFSKNRQGRFRESWCSRKSLKRSFGAV
jgi:transposase